MRFPTNSTHVFLQISKNSIICTTGISKKHANSYKTAIHYMQKQKFPHQNLLQRPLSSIQEFQYSLAIVRGFVVRSVAVVLVNVEFYRSSISL